jgi:hypothetical protein
MAGFGRFSSRVDDRSTSGKLVIGVAFGSTPEWRDRTDVTQPLHQAIGSFGALANLFMARRHLLRCQTA